MPVFPINSTSIWITIICLMPALFAYHLILKIYSIKEVSNNLKLLSDLTKNCDQSKHETQILQDKLILGADLLLAKNLEYLNFENHYKEAFMYLSCLPTILLALISTATLGLVLSAVLGYGHLLAKLGTWDIVLLASVLVFIFIALGKSIKDMLAFDKRKATSFWIPLIFIIGLVFGSVQIQRFAEIAKTTTSITSK